MGTFSMLVNLTFGTSKNSVLFVGEVCAKDYRLYNHVDLFTLCPTFYCRFQDVT
jgi:hypothetical protein